jgi:regulator of sigma E protease
LFFNMQSLHDVVVAIVAFIILIGVMVVVHEFGHFAVAKLCGVRVESFSVGFGPRLFGVKYGDTDYKVCLLPLGGYVKMTGETPDQIATTAEDSAAVSAEDPGAFTSHPRWQRMLIGVAGPVANFILAFVLMGWYYAFINEVPLHETTSTTIEWVATDSVAAQAGFKPGDQVVRFGSAQRPDWEKIDEQANFNFNQTVPVTVDRDGQPVQLSLQLPPDIKGHDFDISDVGIIPQYVRGPIGVYDVPPGTPAAKAGLQGGDSIVAVDGHAFHTVESLLAYLQAGKGARITLTVTRNGATLPPMAVDPTKLENGWKLGFEAVPPPMRNDPLPAGKAIDKANDFCRDKSLLIVEVLQGLFTRRVAVSQLSGPVGIARMAGQAASMRGWFPKIGLAAAISLNLGILNLMPFPILDGGLILLLLIESVIRHDISIAVKERIYQAAFVVLVVFFAFIIFNDVTKLPIFTHVKP